MTPSTLGMLGVCVAPKLAEKVTVPPARAAAEVKEAERRMMGERTASKRMRERTASSDTYDARRCSLLFCIFLIDML
jgi:hypothetical protein